MDARGPAAAKPCPTCGELTGRGYPSCLGCAEEVEQRWLADWHELLAAERASAGTESERSLATRVLSASPGEFAWTCVDWALRLQRCAECGGELGAGDPVCLHCAAADAARWMSLAGESSGESSAGVSSSSVSLPAGAEHRLRQAVLTLRAPQRRRAAVVATSRLVLPFLVAGDSVTTGELRAIRAAVLAGRYTDLARLERLPELANLPLPPWR